PAVLKRKWWLMTRSAASPRSPSSAGRWLAAPPSPPTPLALPSLISPPVRLLDGGVRPSNTHRMPDRLRLEEAFDPPDPLAAALVEPPGRAERHVGLHPLDVVGPFALELGQERLIRRPGVDGEDLAVLRQVRGHLRPLPGEHVDHAAG